MAMALSIVARAFEVNEGGWGVAGSYQDSINVMLQANLSPAGPVLSAKQETSRIE